MTAETLLRYVVLPTIRRTNTTPSEYLSECLAKIAGEIDNAVGLRRDNLLASYRLYQAARRIVI